VEVVCSKIRTGWYLREETTVNKKLLSLNFMHCMERFATQIYRTQKGAFGGGQIDQKLIEASENESGHAEKLRAQIITLGGRVYPLGLLFQFMGVILGSVTRLSGKGNLLRADILVETRAVKDYSSFVKAVSFDSSTVELIGRIIADEERHIITWKKARESFSVNNPSSV
jgi:rubrerythrin